MLAVGTDHHLCGHGAALAVASMSLYAGDPVAVPEQRVDPEVLDYLGTGLPRRIDKDRVEHRPARAVERVDALTRREVAVQDRPARIEPDRARRRCVARDHPIE